MKSKKFLTKSPKLKNQRMKLENRVEIDDNWPDLSVCCLKNDDL